MGERNLFDQRVFPFSFRKYKIPEVPEEIGEQWHKEVKKLQTILLSPENR